jgi:hypothetical protein
MRVVILDDYPRACVGLIARLLGAGAVLLAPPNALRRPHPGDVEEAPGRRSMAWR